MISSLDPLLMLWIIGGVAALSAPSVTVNWRRQCRVQVANTIFSRKFIIRRLGSCGIRVCYGWIAAPVALAAMALAIFQRSFGAGSPVVPVVRVVWISPFFMWGICESGAPFQNVTDAGEIASYRRADRGGLSLFHQNSRSVSCLPGDKAAILRGHSRRTVYVMYSYSGWMRQRISAAENQAT